MPHRAPGPVGEHFAPPQNSESTVSYYFWGAPSIFMGAHPRFCHDFGKFVWEGGQIWMMPFKFASLFYINPPIPFWPPPGFRKENVLSLRFAPKSMKFWQNLWDFRPKSMRFRQNLWDLDRTLCYLNFKSESLKSFPKSLRFKPESLRFWPNSLRDAPKSLWFGPKSLSFQPKSLRVWPKY